MLYEQRSNLETIKQFYWRLLLFTTLAKRSFVYKYVDLSGTRKKSQSIW